MVNDSVERSGEGGEGDVRDQEIAADGPRAPLEVTIVGGGQDERWRRWNLWLTIVNAGAALILAVLTGFYTHYTSKMLQAQVEPSLDAEVVQPSMAFQITNDGVDRIDDISVRLELSGYSKAAGEFTSFFPIDYPSRDQSRPYWWKIDRLSARETRNKVTDDVISFAVKSLAEPSLNPAVRASYKGTPAAGVLPHAHILFRIQYYRSVDRKRFVTSHMALLAMDENGRGKLSELFYPPDYASFEKLPIPLQPPPLPAGGSR